MFTSPYEGCIYPPLGGFYEYDHRHDITKPNSKLVTKKKSELNVLHNKVIALIPARGGSKGVPKKNLRAINGISLVRRSAMIANECCGIEQVYVSTDDMAIANQVHDIATVINRSPEISNDTASTESAISHFLENERTASIIVLIQCTSPFTIPDDIINALAQFHCENRDSLLSVTPGQGGFHCGGFDWKINSDRKAKSIDYKPNQRPRRQDTYEKFRENGAFYIFTRECFEKHQSRLGGSIGMYVMPQNRSFEIDNADDLKLANKLSKWFNLDE